MRFTYQPGDQPLSGYTIQRGIHRGGFGEVYFAYSEGGKEVALKLLHKEDQEIEVRGVTQCLNLKHPNLVNLFDIKTDGHGDQWVVMEYVSGSSLEDVLASFPDGLPINEVREWLSGLVAGVAHLHDRGIVHRDLKPANVYRENGVVKVGDVGLSKRLNSDHRRQHTQSVGTVYYMAPEVARGQYGPEVDVYSLGVMLYELISGKLPFTGETTAEILMKHLTAQPDLTLIPTALRPAIARALEKDPRKRTPTVRALDRDFLQAIGGVAEPQWIPESSFLPPNPPRASGQSFAGTGNRNGERIPGRSPGPEFPHPKMSFSPPLRNASKLPDRNTPIKVIAIIVVIMCVMGRIRGEMPSIASLAVMGFIGYAVFQLQKPGHRGVFPGGPAPLEPAPQPVYQPAPARPMAARRSIRDSAPCKIEIPWNQRWPQLANSIGVAGLVASVLSVAVSIWPQVFPTIRPAVIPTGDHAVFFVATSIVASWLFLIGNAVTSSPTWTNQGRWFARLVAGSLLGTFAYALDQFLLIDIPPHAFTARSAVTTLGNYPLTGPHLDPTWLGYVCFFAIWMGLRRWTRETDPRRAKRLKVWTVGTAVLAAFAVSMVFKFPQWYAMLWAGTISTTVQLASDWNPRRQQSPVTTRRTADLT